MMSGFSALYKVISAYLKNDFISPFQYGSGYDEIAGHYLWNRFVGYHSKLLLGNEEVIKPGAKVIDLACGTGFLTEKLVRLYPDGEICGIDTSRELLDIAEKNCPAGITFLHSDVSAFLETCGDNSVDAVYSAWAWPYFGSRQTMAHIARILRPGGLLGVISNRRGTLKGLEKNFIKVIFKRGNDFVKPMQALRNLPHHIGSFEAAFKKYGFSLQSGGEGEVRIQRETISELWDWIHKAGVSAGVSSVFRNWESVKEDFLQLLEKDLRAPGGYSVNHSFLWSIMRLTHSQ